jgi:murein DD-endopeptidase MepM/ murein hydrolase activator NlpD
MNDLRDTCLVSSQILVVPVVDEENVVIQNYRVCWGDTLFGIASRFNVSVRDLIEINNIKNPDKLVTGQSLTIPEQFNDFGVPVFNDTVELSSRSNIVNLNWPVIGTITSRFGPRGNSFHHGLDIAAPTGTLIKAARSGEVIFSGWKNNIYGYTVIINHGGSTRTMYAHNSKNIVDEGQYVKNGDLVAKVGETGNATGPHVHFGVYINEEPVDPERYLK